MGVGSVLYFISLLLLINSLLHIWSKKNPKRMVLGLIMLCYSLEALHDGLFFTKHILLVPSLFGASTILNPFLILFFYFYLRSGLDTTFYWTKKYWLFFLYPFINIILFIPHLLLTRDEQILLIAQAFERDSLAYFPTEFGLYLHSSVLVVFYTVAIRLFLQKFQWKKALDQKQHIVKIATITVILWILLMASIDIAYYFTSAVKIELQSWIIMFNYIMVLFFMIFIQIWPYYYQSGSLYFDTASFDINKYIRSYLDGVDLSDLNRKIMHTLDKKKVYRDENINLPRFAEICGVTVHQLSEYLNRHMNIRFMDLINQKRVEEARELLEERADKNILEICYDVGYNSSSAFYKSFKKMTGFTPKAYREKSKKFSIVITKEDKPQ